MLWRNANLTHLGRREHHSTLAGPDFLLRTDDVDLNRIGHDRYWFAYETVFAFSTASSIPPTM